jgi:hypothetical protein
MLLLLSLLAPAHSAPISHQAMCMSFNDEFDTLDTQRWTHDITMGGGGNWEFEWLFNLTQGTLITAQTHLSKMESYTWYIINYPDADSDKRQYGRERND